MNLVETPRDLVLKLRSDLKPVGTITVRAVEYRREYVERLIAVLERAELLEAALVELAKRASDPDIEATTVGARIMLEQALMDTKFALAGKRRP